MEDEELEQSATLKAFGITTSWQGSKTVVFPNDQEMTVVRPGANSDRHVWKVVKTFIDKINSVW